MEVNLLAVLSAGVVAMVVGGLWYSPLLFGKQWMREMGKSPDEMKGMAFPVRPMLTQFLGSLVLAFVLSFFAFGLNVGTVGEAVTLAAWIWLGFYVTSELNGVLWEGGTWKLYLINIGNWLVTLVLMAVVIELLT